MKYLIVGCGLSGATLARLFAEDDISVDIIDKRSHIGGNTFDYIDDSTGIRLSKYGAHIFHTDSERVWEFVNRFSHWKNYEHKVLSAVNDKLVPVPVNITTVNELFNLGIETKEQMDIYLQSIQLDGPILNSRDSALSRVGVTLYHLMFENYTKKQWDKYPEELEPDVLARIPVRNNFFDGYFSDKYQALPLYGYDRFVANMLNHLNININLDTEFTSGMEKGYDKVFFTGKIDSYFNNMHGKLEYRSLNFEYETVDIDDYQPTSVVNYPSLDVPYTRIIDYKKFYPEITDSKKSIIAKEYSSGKGEAYYPVPNQKNRDLYKLYQDEAKELEHDGIYFVGRLANYKYFNMDAAIQNAIELYEIIKKGEIS